MNLEEAIEKAAQVSDEMVLVAKPPFTWGAEAQYVMLTNDCSVPKPVLDAGFEFLLDHEDLMTQLGYLKSKKVSGRTAAEFVIHYVMNDSWPAWFSDLPEA